MDFIEGMLAGQQYQMNQFKLQEAPIKLQEEKLALQIGQSDFDKRQKMADMLTKSPIPLTGDQNPLTTASNALVRMGTAAAEVGLPEEAASDFAKASTISAQQEHAAYNAMQSAINKAKFADQLLGNVHDQASWDQMNGYIEMTTGQKSQMADKKYSPELVESLRQASLTHRTSAQEAYTLAQAEHQQALTKVSLAEIPLRKAQTENYEARTEALKKNGADGMIAKPKTIAAVSDLIISESGDVTSRADANVSAREIAIDAERRMREDHQTQPEAVKAAYKYAKNHGILSGQPMAHLRPGASEKKPLPLPKTPSEFKDNMWYQAPDGPRHYDSETQMLYKPGEGPGDEDEGGKDDEGEE
jgi:hypothetical protein